MMQIDDDVDVHYDDNKRNSVVVDDDDIRFPMIKSRKRYKDATSHDAVLVDATGGSQQRQRYLGTGASWQYTTTATTTSSNYSDRQNHNYDPQQQREGSVTNTIVLRDHLGDPSQQIMISSSRRTPAMPFSTVVPLVQQTNHHQHRNADKTNWSLTTHQRGHSRKEQCKIAKRKVMRALLSSPPSQSQQQKQQQQL